MRWAFSAATALDRGGEYRRVHAPRSALSLTKIPRRTQTAWAWNLVWEWELGLGYRPSATLRWQQRDRAAVSIGTSTLRPPRASARKLLLSPRSLRTQDRSRGALTRHPPRATASASLPQAICVNGPFCVNRWDRPRDTAGSHVGDEVVTEGRAFDLGPTFHESSEVVGHLLRTDRSVEALEDQISRFDPTQMTQHHFTREHH